MLLTTRFIIIALVIFYLTLTFGGRPWAILCLVALVIQAVTDLRATTTLAGIAPCLAWLALFHATENRELFFPFSMLLASYITFLLADRSLWLGIGGGAMVVAAFIGVRIAQSATAQVLAVELTVALVVLTIGLLCYLSNPRTMASRAAFSGLASLLAFVGLSA
jgi:hypothetical protein